MSIMPLFFLFSFYFRLYFLIFFSTFFLIFFRRSLSSRAVAPVPPPPRSPRLPPTAPPIKLTAASYLAGLRSCRLQPHGAPIPPPPELPAASHLAVLRSHRLPAPLADLRRCRMVAVAAAGAWCQHPHLLFLSSGGTKRPYPPSPSCSSSGRRARMAGATLSCFSPTTCSVRRGNGEAG
jgi:hypothetical protein